MFSGVRRKVVLAGGVAVLAAVAVPGASIFAPEAEAQVLTPYVPDADWGRLPGDRDWGAVSGVMPDPSDGGLWVLDRCGQNSCLDAPERHPVVKLDAEGNVVREFGAGMTSWPHGLYLDHEGNVWVADAEGFQETPDDLGHVVYKFSPRGELLLTLGEAGVRGSDEGHFAHPNDVAVDRDGNIYVADGHRPEGNNRIVKFDRNGNYVTEWGEEGSAPGQFDEPHAVEVDPQGRVYVGDRYNNRVQIFTPDGEFIESWTQFGRPSGIYITDEGLIVVADSESNVPRDQRGWRRGIRIGSIDDGWVRAFVPDDTEINPDESGTSFAEWAAMDEEGNIYTGEVGPRNMRKFVPLFEWWKP